MAEPDAYSRLQVTLHWTIAALVIAQFVVNDDVRSAFRGRVTGEIAIAETGLAPGALFHIGSGLVILALTMLRFGIRLWRGIPAPVEGVHPLILGLAAITHIALYGFLFLMPITGAIAWLTGLTVPATLHEVGRLLLLPLIAAHAFGALVEHFVLRKDSLRRMLWDTGR